MFQDLPPVKFENPPKSLLASGLIPLQKVD
jgi:hypothetical protein